MASISGTFDEDGVSGQVQIGGRGLLMLHGAGVGDVTLQRLALDGATWVPVSKNIDGDPATWSMDGTNAVSVIVDTERCPGIFRLECASHVDDDILYQLGDGE